MNKEETLRKLRDLIIEGDAEGAKNISKQALNMGIDPVEAIKEGLVKALDVVGEKWRKLEIFLPHVMLAVDAMKAAMEILKPKIVAEKMDEMRTGTVVIGTVQGDIHDIGKTLVATMLEVSGFEVHDLGIDVPPMDFVDRANVVKADIIAMSALMATSMPYFEDVIGILKHTGVREKYKVMVGGGPVTREYANEIGADAYGKDAEEASRIALKLMGK